MVGEYSFVKPFNVGNICLADHRLLMLKNTYFDSLIHGGAGTALSLTAGILRSAHLAVAMH
jgi:hypothetical protein